MVYLHGSIITKSDVYSYPPEHILLRQAINIVNYAGKLPSLDHAMILSLVIRNNLEVHNYSTILY